MGKCNFVVNLSQDYMYKMRMLQLLIFAVIAVVASAQVKKSNKMKENSNLTAIEVYDTMKEMGRMENPVRINVSGYAVKVGPDVYGLPSVEVSESKGGKARVLCVLPFSDYLKLRHVRKGDRVTMNGELRGYVSEYDIALTKQSKIVTVNGKKP